MTKYILDGGSAAYKDPLNFYRSVVEGIDKQLISILLIDLASVNPEQLNLYLHQNKKASPRNPGMFQFANPHKIATVTLEVGDLFRTIPKYDVIYITGGNGDWLQKNILSLISVSKLKEVVRDKIVVGCSAGVNMWSQIYYSNDNRRIMNGLGINKLATFCHYSSSKYPALNSLFVSSLHQQVGSVIPLSDDEFVVYQD